MRINQTIHYDNAYPHRINGSERYNNRIGFWADVIDVDSSTNTVSVISDQGIEIPYIPVASKEWVVKEENKEFASVERWLPQIGTRVFVLVPDGNIANGFVLCSGIPRGEPDVQTLYCDADNSTDEGQKKIQKDNRIGERISQGGWHRKEYFDNGSICFNTDDGNVKLEVTTVTDDDNELTQKIRLEAWGNSIELIPEDDDEKGTKKSITISLLGNSIELKEEGLIIQDAKNNKIETSNDGVKITDKNNNEFVMANSGVNINGYFSVNKKAGA